MPSGSDHPAALPDPGRDGDPAVADSPDQSGDAPDQGTGRPRTATSTAEIDTTLIHPGSVRINVKGAFIVDQGSASPTNGNGRGSPGHHETKDIRLPNHTAVVSHIAVDVCPSLRPVPWFSR